MMNLSVRPAGLIKSSLMADHNPMTKQPFASTMKKYAAAPQRHPETTLEAPSEFCFDYNFDENGVLYYLGTFGKRRNWQNPHSVGQV